MNSSIKRVHANDLMDAYKVGKLLYLGVSPRYSYDEQAKRYTNEVIALNVQCMPVECAAAPIVVRLPCDAETALPQPGNEIRFVGLVATPYIATSHGGRSYIAVSFKADGVMID